MISRVLSVILIAAIITGCRKSDRDIDKDTQSSQDYLQAQSYFLTPATMALELLNARPELNFEADTANHYQGSCPAITITPAYPDSTTFPKVIELNYGASNCTGADGLSRRGVLVVTIPADPWITGNEIRIVPSGYFINDKELRGTITLQYKGRNTSLLPVYIENIADGELRHSSSVVTYFDAMLTREWKKGDTTSTKADDEFSITGKGTGYGIRGASLNFEIKTALNVINSCAYPQTGTVSLKPGNLSERFIDIGSGCDANGKVTIFENSYDVTFN